jgi:hypothetical protein
MTRTQSTETGMSGRVRAGAIAIGILAAGLGLAQPAAGEGIQWEDLTIEQALAKGERTGSIILVDIHASHCMQCAVMDKELWQTPEAAALGEGLVAVNYPSDKPEGIEVQRRYPVLGLPLVIFLNPDGTELDRIVGYRDPASWLAEARPLKAGVDPLPGLEQELQAKPESAPTIYAVFEKYLYHNRVDEAEALLERLIKLDPQRKGGLSTMALTLLAKYYDYFRGDIARSQYIYRTIVEQYPTSDGVTGALKETYDYHHEHGTLTEWVDWVCPIAMAHPQSRYLNRYTATFALSGGQTGDCLAQAARNAALLESNERLKVYMDSVAVVLEGEGK